MRRFIDRFREVCERVGDRAMIRYGQESLSYAQVDEESARVYRYLRDQGVGRECFVHVFMPKEAHFASCMIGVWKAGAALMLTEDTYPAERVGFMRRDVGCALVLDQALFERIMAECEPLGGHEEVDDHDAAYVVYTSGSTGTPKGVLHEYGNLDQCAAVVPEADELPEARYGYVPPLHFVAAIFFLVEGVLAGMTICVVSGALLRDFEGFSRFIEDERIERIYLPPSYLRLYRRPAPCLTHVTTGSEPANGLYYEGGVPEITNYYSMSEAGFCVLRKVLDHAFDVAPVGKPCLPIRIGLRAEDGSEIEGPGEGELFFENRYVRGYVNRPELTERAFRDGFYYTGDVCRRDEQGDYYVAGRNDDMIKIHGNRVEPAEVEAAIKRLTGLAQVAVKGFEENGRAFICAFFVTGEAGRLGVLRDGELIVDTDALARMLPSYMIPTYYVGLEAFPINVNGKLARKELRAPERVRAERSFEEPANEREAYLCDRMAEALGLERVGATEDFYQIGGDSLSCIRLVSLCDELPVSASDVFELRSARALAAHYATSGAVDADAAEREARTMDLPLLLMQEQYIYLQQQVPDSLLLNLVGLWRLRPDVEVERLAAAVDATLAAHPALCTRIVVRPDGSHAQRFDETLFAPCERVRMSEEEFRAKVPTLNRRFDLFGARLYDCALFETEASAYLFFNVHHAIADGTSLRLIIDEFFERYADAGFESAPDRYFSVVRGIAEPEPGRLAEATAHYDGLWERDSIASCPRWLSRDHESDLRENGVIYDWEAFERREGRTPTLFMCAVLVALARVDGAGQALVTSLYATRDDHERMAAAGVLITPVVVHVRVDEGTDPKALLADVEGQERYAQAHPECPLAARIEGSADVTRFIYQKDMVNAPSRLDALVDEAIDVAVNDRMTGTLSVGIVDNEGSERIGLAIRYDASRYEREHVERFAALVRESLAWMEGE